MAQPNDFLNCTGDVWRCQVVKVAFWDWYLANIHVNRRLCNSDMLQIARFDDVTALLIEILESSGVLHSVDWLEVTSSLKQYLPVQEVFQDYLPTFKMKALFSLNHSLAIYQSTWHHFPKDVNFHASRY